MSLLDLLAPEVLDPVVEGVRAAIHLIEKRRQIPAADLVGRGEELVRRRVLELPAGEERGQDPLERRPPEPSLHRIEPQRGLVVSDVATGRRIELIGRRRGNIALRRRPIPRESVPHGLALEPDVPEDPWDEAAEEAM